MGYKKLSKEQEQQLVKEYIDGASVISLMAKYNFATKKSITDKVKKYHPNDYSEIIKLAQQNRKGYSYVMETLNSDFDAYYLGLLLTDGYVQGDKVGLDLTDKDCIEFLSKTIGKEYQSYEHQEYKTRYRLILSDKKLVTNLERFGIVPNKSLTLQPPRLLKEEEKFIPYIIRGIIDGDGCVSPTSYGGAQFYIATMSEDFAKWIKEILEERLFMRDIRLRQSQQGIWRIDTAEQYNILKLIALVYDKPFGMGRKYNELRKTFRDYNANSLLG